MGEILQSQGDLERLPDVPQKLTLHSLQGHADKHAVLAVYDEGVRKFGPTVIDTASPDAQMKLTLLRVKPVIDRRADFSLSDDEIREALSLLPMEWLLYARLARIEILPTQYLCFDDMGRFDERFAGDYFISGVIDGDVAEHYFTAQEDNPRRTDQGIGPSTRAHYATAQYTPRDATSRLWQEPDEVRAAHDRETCKEYGRNLAMHETLHGVFNDQWPMEFFMSGAWKSFTDLLQEFHEICREEQASVSRYSAMYAPWIRQPFTLKEPTEDPMRDHRVRTALTEEFIELIVAYLRGWAATAHGGAMRTVDRNFGGTALVESGKSRKVRFIEQLLSAPVRNAAIDQAVSEMCIAMRGATKNIVDGTDA